MVAKLDVPAGDVVEEEGAARLQCANAFGDPPVAPPDIFIIFPQIVDTCPVFLAEVERRVGEDRVDAFVADVGKELGAIAPEIRTYV